MKFVFLMLAGFAGPLDSLTSELGRAMRMVELRVSWSDGKFTDAMTVKALMTREDFSLPAPDAMPGLP